MAEADREHVLDEKGPLQLPETWPAKRWVPIARDRVGDIGAVTCVQRSSRDRFFSMTTVYVRRGAGWTSEFENGDTWPEPPTSPRPTSGRPIAMLTSVSGAAVGSPRTDVAFVAGVATTAVAGLRVTSSVDEHDVHVEEETGAFVALTLHPPERTTFRLAALDQEGREIDRIDYQDPWSGGEPAA
jgi:hypothetical protein